MQDEEEFGYDQIPDFLAAFPDLDAEIFPEKDTSNSTPITSLSNNPLLKSQLVCFFAAMRCNHFVFAKCEHS